MNTSPAKFPHLEGTLKISSALSLEQIATKVSRILNVPFQKDNDGEYEEFPAYFTIALGLSVAILENPREDHQYILQVTPDVQPTEDMTQIAWVDLGLWLEAIFHDETEFQVKMTRRPIPPSGDNMG